jgi:hypothetical protein
MIELGRRARLDSSRPAQRLRRQARVGPGTAHVAARSRLMVQGERPSARSRIARKSSPEAGSQSTCAPTAEAVGMSDWFASVHLTRGGVLHFRSDT